MTTHTGKTAKKTVLIADDDGDLCHLLVMRCKQMGLDVLRSPDAMHALLGAHRAGPDLVILDVHMPSGSGLSVCEMLAGDDNLRGIPVIVMSGIADENVRRRCLELGVTFVEKSASLWDRLEPVIRERLGIGATKPLVPVPVAGKAGSAAVVGKGEMGAAAVTGDHVLPVKEEPIEKSSGCPTVLCIDDDPEISKILKMRLAEHGVDVLRAFNGMQGYWTALDMKPDLIVLDLNMPDGHGNYVIGRLKMHPLTQKTPIIVLTGMSTPPGRRLLFGQGIDALLTKPLDFALFLQHLQQYLPIQNRGAGSGGRDATFGGQTLVPSV